MAYFGDPNRDLANLGLGPSVSPWYRDMSDIIEALKLRPVMVMEIWYDWRYDDTASGCLMGAWSVEVPEPFQAGRMNE